jgi:hypothetical protein
MADADAEIFETKFRHSSFEPSDCRGRLKGIIQGESAQVVCNECAAVIYSTTAKDLSTVLRAMQAHITENAPESISNEPEALLKPRLHHIWNNAVAEALNTFLFLLILYGARKFVEWLFGQSKFFDHVPVRQIFDAGDIAVICRFVWNTQMMSSVQPIPTIWQLTTKEFWGYLVWVVSAMIVAGAWPLRYF